MRNPHVRNPDAFEDAGPWLSLGVYAAFRRLLVEAGELEIASIHTARMVAVGKHYDMSPSGLVTFRFLSREQLYAYCWGVEYYERMVSEMAYDALYLFEFGGAT
jgi:hypothetical protein